MIKIKVPKNIIEYCIKQINEYNFGKRGYADGTKEQQLVGIIGQSVIMSYFDAGFIDGSKGFDDGKDLIYNNLIIDIKTMGRTTDVRDYYVNNFLAIQLKYNTDVYIFCSLNKKNYELTICGWITKTKFKEKALFYKKDTIRTRSDGTTFKTFHDLYELNNSDLNDVESIEDLKSKLDKLSLINY